MDLKKKLEYHYRYFDISKISPDPIEFPMRYKDPRDIEISAFLASVFAYGNVRQINSTLIRLDKIMESGPFNFIENYSSKKNLSVIEGIYHRFYSSEDIDGIFNILHRVYTTYGSLKYLFLLYYFEKDRDIKNSLSFFSASLKNIGKNYIKNERLLKFILPDPFSGSACKRMNLFLRWMVRKDHIDFGLWEEVSPAKLIIPVDTHVARISKQIGLTTKNTVSWKMAEEITEKLREINPVDPVKYDFAICHIGMRKFKI
ncbi:MAG: TIGR02757 family protein [Ignavibacteriales bacterium]|nr:TIGR02757 family protein [Ignavibacteriales bacterium]MCF8305023.1 TIGR02757 family protein [Ignavibacteriales bacterium]MCF8314712.1 TIGR02757 family protein [Ignavibacteriales bacterium]MCF8438040.1 TIGR02757 family protein [Ignavibacteriales bacterium]